MTCPSCNSPLEPNARFCGVCGYRLAPARPQGATASGALGAAERARHAPSVQPARSPGPPGAPGRPPSADPSGGAGVAPAQPPAPKPQARVASSPRIKSGDDIYLNEVLNNRFKIESKIGEGGFGAVYRGVQLATGRKVALKLLHPEMTKDENLVARFRREGMVLCNLRDAHTITTYDFDQTPNGTLYIAMELLEGKSLHQVFHSEQQLGWRRMFKILSEMCSSLAEAHAQGIVHRDLKPENIYLESRSGNPDFVKILDFGIAKVMRGDSIDPQSPQLTATGQTLGTLEYMSPEQLMGKPLDGRSDVYALGVLAYEMITGRLPFPDAKGPAGLITAQLKQTPMPPSQASPGSGLPPDADRVILKCLEKDKNNRFPDVTALSAALQEAIAAPASERAALKQPQDPAGPHRGAPAADPLEARRAEPPGMAPPPFPNAPGNGMPGMPPERAAGMRPMGAPPPQAPPFMAPHAGSPVFAPPPMAPSPYGGGPIAPAMQGGTPTPMPGPMPMGTYPQAASYTSPVRQGSSKTLLWWVIALLAIGAGVGTAMALLFS